MYQMYIPILVCVLFLCCCFFFRWTCTNAPVTIKCSNSVSIVWYVYKLELNLGHIQSRNEIQRNSQIKSSIYICIKLRTHVNTRTRNIFWTLWERIHKQHSTSATTTIWSNADSKSLNEQSNFLFVFCFDFARALFFSLKCDCVVLFI